MKLWKTRILIVFSLALLVLAAGLFSLSEKQFPAGFLGTTELPSPSDWVKPEQIKVYPNKIELDIKSATWASFTDTNSMDPFFDAEANALEILPKNAEQIKVGDIISYQSNYGIIIHRVVEIGKDEEGIYYLVKGDNNRFQDPLKVRFEEVRGVVIAVIY